MSYSWLLRLRASAWAPGTWRRSWFTSAKSFYSAPKPFSFAECEDCRLVHESGRGDCCRSCFRARYDGCSSDYRCFLQEEIKANYITVGDAGVFYICNRDKRPFKVIYDLPAMKPLAVRLFLGQTSGSFWSGFGSWDPSAELFRHGWKSSNSAEVLVFVVRIFTTQTSFFKLLQLLSNGWSCYKEHDLFLSGTVLDSPLLSLREDLHGFYIFASNDLDMMTKLSGSLNMVDHWS